MRIGRFSGPLDELFKGSAVFNPANPRAQRRPGWHRFPTRPVRGTVEYGVQTAYAVIDEYMRRGREAASRHQHHPNGSSDMNDDRQNYGNWSAMWGPMSPIVAPWMEAMRMWTSAMTAFVPGAVPQEPWNQYPWGGVSGAAPPSTTGATPPKVSVRVSSPRQTEVTPNLRPGADYTKLVAGPLQSLYKEGALPLTGVSITCDPGHPVHVRVRVTVGTDQPPGIYSGAIRNASGDEVGDLTVEIAGPRGKSA